LVATTEESSEESSPNENVGFFFVGLALPEVLEGFDFLLLGVVLLGESGAASETAVSSSAVSLLLAVVAFFDFDFFSGDEGVALDFEQLPSFALLFFFFVGELSASLLATLLLSPFDEDASFLLFELL